MGMSGYIYDFVISELTQPIILIRAYLSDRYPIIYFPILKVSFPL